MARGRCWRERRLKTTKTDQSSILVDVTLIYVLLDTICRYVFVDLFGQYGQGQGTGANYYIMEISDIKLIT
ncbi:hypothetical protein, partial [Paraglaciecola sp.]|uniref:hypothetical protein n=1 Tax=Paraglaciecola sp. TaxID=1920173 RepID=UPI00329A5641